MAKLAMGKTGPEHWPYLDQLGLKPEHVDQRWNVVTRTSLLKNLGIQERTQQKEPSEIQRAL